MANGVAKRELLVVALGVVVLILGVAAQGMHAPHAVAVGVRTAGDK